MSNPINDAIDTLHTAFVGGPVKEAGEPVSFAIPTQDDAKPLSLLEAAVEAVASFGEDRLSPINEVRQRLQEVHGISGEAAITGLLAEATTAGLIRPLGDRLLLLEAGEEIAIQRGWSMEVLEVEEEERITYDDFGGHPGDDDSARELQELPITLGRAEVLVDTTAKELIRFVKGHPSLTDMHTLLTVEQTGKARKTVLRAIEHRIEELLAEARAEELEREVTEEERLPNPAAGAIAFEVLEEISEEEEERANRSPAEVALDRAFPPEPKVVTVTATPEDAQEALEAPPVVVPAEPDPQPTLQGVPVTPDLPDLSDFSPVEQYLFGRLHALRGQISHLEQRLAELEPAPSSPTPKRQAPKRQPREGMISIGTAQPGTFLQGSRGGMRFLVRAIGTSRVIYQSPTKGWTRGTVSNDWQGSPVEPSEEDRAEVLAILSEQERADLGL